jgi:hypothetical protein
VAFLCQDYTERLSQANTRKLNGAAKLHKATRSTRHAAASRCRSLPTRLASMIYRVRFGLEDPQASCLALLADVLAPYGISEAMIADPFNIFPKSAPISASAH